MSHGRHVDTVNLHLNMQTNRRHCRVFLLRNQKLQQFAVFIHTNNKQVDFLPAFGSKTTKKPFYKTTNLGRCEYKNWSNYGYSLCNDFIDGRTFDCRPFTNLIFVLRKSGSRAVLSKLFSPLVSRF